MSLVLFSFSPEMHGGVAVTSSDPAFDMVEGAEFLVWKPFHEVVLSAGEGGDRTLLCCRFLAISQTESQAVLN